MTIERRQHPRFPMRAEAEVRFSNWTVFKLIYTVNISKGGMNIEMGEAPAVGSRVKIRLVLPDNSPLEVDAVVRHVTSAEAAFGQQFKMRYQVGIEFDNMNRERKDLIEGIIRKNATHAP